MCNFYALTFLFLEQKIFSRFRSGNLKSNPWFHAFGEDLAYTFIYSPGPKRFYWAYTQRMN